ncbi:MAG TPA: M48 family metallopeptidase [Xanthomonadaceae bacterium]|nr:M48 family metallopeptidase [Xanthomonadaceae bacterium]
MNFFERQAQARRMSTRLLVLFGLAVVGIVLAVDVAVWLAWGPGAGEPPSWGLLGFASIATVAVIGLGSLYRVASLRAGGDAVAMQLGGVPVPEDTTDLSLRRLRNVVEEIAIASGVPMPALFVMEHEAGINAFAAGYAPTDAAVAVTRGALERLNRDELQGVIAHEFSHILNGDMRLNIRLMGLLFGILMLGLIGRKVLYLGSGGRRGRGSAPILAAALVAIVIGYVGVFFARMIKAGISRTRESLADAAAVQFTRQTAGLAGALKKIGGLPGGARLADRGDAEEVSHMLFGDGVGFSGLFATHPPLLERIRALEPGFDADRLQALSQQWAQQMPHGLAEDVQLGFAARDAVALPGADRSYAIAPGDVADQVAQPGIDDYVRADSISAALPGPLRAIATRRDSSMALVFALLRDDDPSLARLQDVEVAARLGSGLANAARDLQSGALAGLHPQLRLPLASLAFPVLRLRPRPEVEALLDTVHAVVHVDGRVSLFEYCLGRLLEVQLRESLDPAGHARFGRRKPGQVRSEIATLLCVVAQAGHRDPAEAQRAYLAGMRHILPRDHLPYLPREQGALALDEAWDPLDQLDPLAKQALVEAVTATVAHDGRMRVAEAELLRTVCGVLHCPVPPMLTGG